MRGFKLDYGQVGRSIIVLDCSQPDCHLCSSQQALEGPLAVQKKSVAGIRWESGGKAHWTLAFGQKE